MDSNVSADHILEDSSPNIVKAHVYFYESSIEIKDVDIPFADSLIDFFHFSLFNDKQIHLTTIDQQNGKLQFVLVKITHPGKNFRFEQHDLKSLGQVKFEDAHSFSFFGVNTTFTQKIQKGDLLVIGSERKVISEIISDNELKIDDLFRHVEPEILYNFKIEQKCLLNDLLDVYSTVFTKYAINNPIGEIEKSITVYIALDLKHHKIDDLTDQFSEYFNEMWKKFKEATGKPLDHINNFKSSVISYQCLDNNINELLTEKLLGE